MGGKEMRRRSVARTTLRWDLDNVLFERLERAGVPRLLVRYDDLVSSARGVAQDVMRFLGHPDEDLSFLGDTWADLAPQHSVWGNPSRGRSGREQLRQDDSWRRAMSERDRRVVRALAAPVRRRYGV
jgi:hypothetical protein